MLGDGTQWAADVLKAAHDHGIAALLGVSTRWLRGHDVPGKIQLGHRSTVYSQKTLERYLQRTPPK